MTFPRMKHINHRPAPKPWIRWVAGMTTAPRTATTIAASVASVQSAGWEEVFIFAEPGDIEPLPRGAVLTQHSKTWGPWQNFLIAIRTMLTSYATHAEYVVVFQDDIEVAKNLVDEIDQALLGDVFDPIERVGVVSLYTSRSNQLGQGWRKLSDADLPRRARGALGYVFSREAALSLVGDPPNPNDFAGIDYNVGLWCKRTGRHYWLHSPSFICHTGHTSTIPDRDQGRNRQCHEMIVDCETREIKRFMEGASDGTAEQDSVARNPSL